jgi:hypothetical protein
VGVRDVAHVGEVEEVVVVAELEAGFVGCVRGEGARDELYVAFAEYSCWADGTGQEGWGDGGAVCGQDVGFRNCLRTGSALRCKVVRARQIQSGGDEMGGGQERNIPWW